ASGEAAARPSSLCRLAYVCPSYHPGEVRKDLSRTAAAGAARGEGRLQPRPEPPAPKNSLQGSSPRRAPEPRLQAPWTTEDRGGRSVRSSENAPSFSVSAPPAAPQKFRSLLDPGIDG